jgi:hypothetical protein
MLMPEPADKWRSERSGTDLARIDGIDNLVGERKDRHVEALFREKFMLAGAEMEAPPNRGVSGVLE